MNIGSKKKVLFLITKSNWGGAQRYVFDLATSLPDHFDVVVAHGGSGELVHKLQTAGVRTIAIQSLVRDISFKKELSSLNEVWQILKNERPDILHINSSKAGLYGSLLGRLKRVPRIIFTAHGWAFNEDRPAWQRLLLKYLHYITVLSAHTTIAVSSGLKKQLSWPGIQKKMVVINPGRNPIPFEERVPARAKLPLVTLSEDSFLIATIAELHPIKRLSMMIEALAGLIPQYPHLQYVVFGEGEERKALESLIATKNLTNHVTLLGHQDNAANLLPAFDLFVLPSKSESYGYVLLEAAQAGLPIIASDVGGIPDIITHETTGLLIPPDRADHLQHAITTIIDRPDHATKLAHAAQSEAQERNVARMVESTVACYESSNS